jgi:ribosomal protein L40E
VKRYIYPIVVGAVTAVVGGVTAWWGGRSSVAFLMLATLALGWVVWMAFRAAQALTREPTQVESGVVTGRRRKELEREKQALLKALKELDFDHQMGKVSEKDFNDISTQYRARAIRVMRHLDDAGRDYEAMIEKDLAAKRKGPTADSSQPTVKAEMDSAKCAKCGTRNDSDAEFCKKCGGKLRAEAAS